MKNIGIKILSLLLLILCLSFPAWACSFFHSSIVYGFDSTERVFTGVVIGVVGPFEFKEIKGQVWGLKVKVDEVVYFPELTQQEVEIFDYNLAPDCSRVMVSKEEWEKDYPQGTKIKVISKVPEFLPKESSNKTIRVEIPFRGDGSISRMVSEDGAPMTSAKSYFDYKSFHRPLYSDYKPNRLEYYAAYSLLPEFELRKDLLRLDTAKSKSERIKVLKKLLYFPNYLPTELDFEKIARKNISDQKLLKKLLIERTMWLKN